MWIEKIELTNFKAYRHQKFIFPKPENGRNLVLIGGMNGYGKTTLLEAIYLCLYGEDATHYLARAGLQPNSYAKFLQCALHGKALSTRLDSMRVSMRLIVEENFGFEITRTWFFNPRGEFQDQDVRLDEIRDGIARPLDTEEYLSSILEEYAVPANLAPFFYFDGEEVKKLADQDRVGWIKQGMESLMGVVLVKKLRDRLTQYQSNRRVNGHNVNKSNLDEMLNSLNRKIAEYEKIKNDLIVCNEDIAQDQIRRDKIQSELMSLNIGGGSIKSVEDIVREEAAKRQALEQCEKQLENLLADCLPFHLVSNNIFQSLNNRLSGEKVRIDWDMQKRELEPRKDKFTDAFFETQPMTVMLKKSETAKKVLTSCINEAWETLYSPRPDGCASIILHDYLESRQRNKLDESFTTIKVGANQIRSLVAKRKEIKIKLEDLKIRRLKLEGIHDDGVLEKYNRELADVQSELEGKNKILGDLERQEKALYSEINQAQASYKRENELYIKSEPVKSFANKSQKVINLIDELLPRLFELKTQELSQAVTARYKQLAHKEQIDNIVIHSDGSCHLFAKDGKEVKFDRAAGENQLFATSLYAGLAQVSGYHIPLVVDTPLARLDSKHRKNLLNYWCSDPNRQVILLSQDEEIDEQLMQSVNSNLSKTYLLESTPIGEGVYKTIAKENTYFGVQ